MTLQPALLDLTQTAWRLARARLRDLTDEEFFWEPVEGCWSVRLTTQLRTPLPDEAPPGEWCFDWTWDQPDPAPFTTIGWLVTHMTYGTWNWIDIIAGRPVAPEPPVPSDAASAVKQWDGVVTRFTELVAGSTDGELLEAITAWDDQRVPRHHLITHVVTEVLHHAAEVGRLRDLYRHRGGWLGSGVRRGTAGR